MRNPTLTLTINGQHTPTAIQSLIPTNVVHVFTGAQTIMIFLNTPWRKEAEYVELVAKVCAAYDLPASAVFVQISDGQRLYSLGTQGQIVRVPTVDTRRRS